MFRKKLKGTAAIQAGINQFETIASQIQAGVEDNKAKVEANCRTIAALRETNLALENDAARGESVASKLRALIA